ncbi:MAG: GntR family transcriptional regulator [Chthoniobacterales bacterium]
MLPFRIQLQPGHPIYEQIVMAVRRACGTGVLKSGDRFPAVRTIAGELGVNPNTVQKAVAELTRAGLLEVRTGQGCFVAGQRTPPKTERAAQVRRKIRELLVDAANLGISQQELLQLIKTEHRKLHEPRH